MVKAGRYWLISRHFISEEKANEAYDKAAFHMSTLNMYAASLMKKH